MRRRGLVLVAILGDKYPVVLKALIKELLKIEAFHKKLLNFIVI